MSIDILWTISERVGSPSRVIHLNASAHEPSSIWLAVNIHKGKLVVMGKNKRSFLFELKGIRANKMNPLKEYLEEKMLEVARGGVLQKRVSSPSTRVTLSIDRTIRYRHVIPIIDVIADLGFSNYSFEVRKTPETSNLKG